MKRWLQATCLALAATASSACGSYNDGVVAVTATFGKSIDSTGMCNGPMNTMGMQCGAPTMTPLVYEGIYDVGIAVARDADYILTPLVVNRPMSRSVGGIDLNAVFLSGIDIELVPTASSKAVSAGIPAVVRQRSIPIGGPLLNSNCQFYFPDYLAVIDRAIAKSVVDAQVLTAGRPELGASPQIVTVRLRYRYTQSGVQGVSNWLEFPVQFCLYCLALDPATNKRAIIPPDKTELPMCPVPAAGNSLTFPDACANGLAQDQEMFCCQKDRKVFCGKDIPTM